MNIHKNAWKINKSLLQCLCKTWPYSSKNANRFIARYNIPYTVELSKFVGPIFMDCLNFTGSCIFLYLRTEIWLYKPKLLIPWGVNWWMRRILRKLSHYKTLWLHCIMVNEWSCALNTILNVRNIQVVYELLLRYWKYYTI